MEHETDLIDWRHPRVSKAAIGIGFVVIAAFIAAGAIVWSWW